MRACDLGYLRTTLVDVHAPLLSADWGQSSSLHGQPRRVGRRFNVSDYRWFDLRDADSASGSFESHYGLLRDDYSPKPAFEAFRSLVASRG